MPVEIQKFQNKYTIKSTRLENYDYTQNGLYFVTICTKDREELFGIIKNEKMILNEVGKIANRFWQEIPRHFPFVNLDEFVVMPNHAHGILEIWKNPVETQFIASRTNITPQIIDKPEINIANETQNGSMGQNEISRQDSMICQDAFSHQDTITCQDALKCVSTVGNNKKPGGGVAGSKNPSLNPGSLSNIIKWYKGRCAFEIRKQLDPITFAWQPRFYDHIIRNDEALNKIREYIITNPARWERDRNNEKEDIWM
jgi:REP element-mobilizing transposase RayT